MENSKVPSAKSDRDIDKEISTLKKMLRVTNVVDLIQSFLIGALVVRVWRLQSELGGTVRLVSQLTDVIHQLLRDVEHLAGLLSLQLGGLGQLTDALCVLFDGCA